MQARIRSVSRDSCRDSRGRIRRARGCGQGRTERLTQGKVVVQVILALRLAYIVESSSYELGCDCGAVLKGDRKRIAIIVKGTVGQSLSRNCI